MLVFKNKQVDPLLLILGFGMIICMVLCAVTMSQMGALQTQIDVLTEELSTYKTYPVTKEETKPAITQEVQTMNITANDIQLTANQVVIEAAENIVLPENEIEESHVYTDEGIFSPSGLSVDQLNLIIEKALQYYKRPPSEYGGYNLGAAFKEAEDRYGVNAVYLIAITHRESGFNTSDNAFDHNNMTSITMSDGTLKYYDSFYDNIVDTGRLLGEVYRDKRGKTNIYDVGEMYNPVNSSWPLKVQESVTIFYSLLNNA